MESIIHADLDVNRELLKLIASMTAQEDGGFISISTTKGVVHIGIRGMSMSFFRASHTPVCNIALPEDYIVSVSIDCVRQWLRSSECASEQFASLGDVRFCPKLKMRRKLHERKVRNYNHDHMVQENGEMQE